MRLRWRPMRFAALPLSPRSVSRPPDNAIGAGRDVWDLRGRLRDGEGRLAAEEARFQPAGPRKQEAFFRRAFFDRFGLQTVSLRPERDRGFESRFLHWRVCCEPDFLSLAHHGLPPHSSAVSTIEATQAVTPMRRL
jgi:hypothetical protein